MSTTTSLWLSFSAGNVPAARLTGRFPAPAVDAITRLVDDVLARNPGGGELVVSRREDTVLIEVLSRHPGGADSPGTSADRGSFPVDGGTVTWIELPLP
ncbi:hypothetical protein [Cryptosporangium japonicum]|uniref:Uncharacterized protein n=1 Tax=Cryptosporangium japonicum TaxID=80872 RepID=A0ABP3DWC3_9ACTN